MQFTFGRDQLSTRRASYALLDWLGDCGGLIDALFFIAEFLIAPFSAFVLQTKLASILVRFRKSDPFEKDQSFGSRKPKSYIDQSLDANLDSVDGG